MPSSLLYAGSEIYCGCVVRWFDRPLVAVGVSGYGLFPMCSGGYSFISLSVSCVSNMFLFIPLIGSEQDVCIVIFVGSSYLSSGGL
jgi:hypothetical protein